MTPVKDKIVGTDIIDAVIPASQEKTRNNVRLMIPVLVHWAKTGRKDKVYGDLNHAIGKEKFSGIGYSLYAVQIVLDELAHRYNTEIPTLNSLCKNSKSMLPSEGFEFVSPTYNKLDDDGKRVFVEGLDCKAINYPKWDWVLKELGLQEATSLTDEELEEIKKPHAYGKGGEGEEHKKLKEYILSHPDALGYKNVVLSKAEHELPSGDKLDVYFEFSDGTHVAVEVKPSTSPDSDLTRGIFQCVKYRAVMEALRQVENGSYDIHTLLVSTRSLSEIHKKLADILAVNFKEEFKITKNK